MAKKVQNEKQEEQNERPKIVYVESQLPSIYANHAQMRFSGVDAYIMFGELVGVGENGENLIVPRVKVLLSLPFAKQFAELVTQNIAIVEKQGTTIPAVEFHIGQSNE